MSVFDEIEESERQQNSNEGLTELIQRLITTADNMEVVDENLKEFVSVCQSLKRQQDKASIDALEEIKASGKANVQEVENVLSKYAKDIKSSNEKSNKVLSELERLTDEIEWVRKQGIKVAIKDEGNKVSRYLNKKFYWILGIAVILIISSGSCFGWLIIQNKEAYYDRQALEKQTDSLTTLKEKYKVQIEFVDWFATGYKEKNPNTYDKILNSYDKYLKKK